MDGWLAWDRAERFHNRIRVHRCRRSNAIVQLLRQSKKQKKQKRQRRSTPVVHLKYAHDERGDDETEPAPAFVSGGPSNGKSKAKRRERGGVDWVWIDRFRQAEAVDFERRSGIAGWERPSIDRRDPVIQMVCGAGAKGGTRRPRRSGGGSNDASPNNIRKSGCSPVSDEEAADNRLFQRPATSSSTSRTTPRRRGEVVGCGWVVDAHGRTEITFF